MKSFWVFFRQHILKKRGLALSVAFLVIIFVNIAVLPSKYAPHVQTQKMVLAPLMLMVRASGNLEAKDSNTVRAQFDGSIVKKVFREGQPVQKGQLLAVIGRERIRQDYQNKIDNLKNAKADLTHASRDLKLQKMLFKKQAVAYSSVYDAQRGLVKAEQALRNAEEGMKLAQAQWDSSNVVAPLSGTIVKDWIGDDKFISAGKEIITVADVSEFTVHAKVDELDVKQVHEGQMAEVRLQIYPQMVFPAVVTQMGSSPDGPGLPEVPVVLRLRSTQGQLLRPKLSAEARILTGVTEPVLSVPLTAIANTDGTPKVWILGAFNRLRSSPVTVSRASPERIEVVDGVKAGQRICMNAETTFEQGMFVLVNKPLVIPKKK